MTINQGDVARVEFVVPSMHNLNTYSNSYGVSLNMDLTVKEASLWGQHKAKILFAFAFIYCFCIGYTLFKDNLADGSRKAPPPLV
jgi:hypothetical protein